MSSTRLKNPVSDYRRNPDVSSPDDLWEENIINYPDYVLRSKFLSLCLLKKPRFLLISGHELTKVNTLYQYNLETTTHVAIFENETGIVEDIVSVLANRIAATLIYSDSFNFSQVMKLPWALRGEVPLYAMNLVAYSLFNGKFVISVVKEVGYETDEFIYPYYLVPYR